MWWFGRKKKSSGKEETKRDPLDLGAVVPRAWDDDGEAPSATREMPSANVDKPPVRSPLIGVSTRSETGPSSEGAQPVGAIATHRQTEADKHTADEIASLGTASSPAERGVGGGAVKPLASDGIDLAAIATLLKSLGSASEASAKSDATTSGEVAQDGSAHPKPRRILTLPRAAMAAGLAAGVFALWLGSNIFYYTLKYPDPFQLQSRNSAPVIRILDAGGKTIAERGGAHPYMPLALLPRHVIDAVVAIEDRKFFDHWGIDPAGLARAALTNMRAGRFVQGGSTLTQQLAKNMFLSSERTMTRKFDELAIAAWLETRLSKEEILELYLNRVYFGGGCYGIESAAQRYFGKSARALTVAEAAVLAGLLKAPSRFAPSSNPGLARSRGRLVLAKMQEAGLLSASGFEAARNQQIRFKRQSRQMRVDGTEYAVDFVLSRMPGLIDSDHGDLIVETTLNAGLQRHAHKTVVQLMSERGSALSAEQAAVVVMNTTGGITAMIGGVDYAKSQFNRATKAMRQPGSTFKPFVYLAALESGMKPSTTTYDLPISVDGWAPRNANGQYVGAVSLRQALSRSINTVAVRLGLDVGPANVISLANRLGVSSDLKPEPSLALGTSEVTLIEMVGAYNTFAAGGQRVEPHIIRRIRSSSGRVLYARAMPASGRVVSAPHIGAMNDMLNAALVRGTGRRAGLARHPAAGKTGTSQGYRDAWFIGYTAHMTAGIWMGNDKGQKMKKVSGGSIPAEIWRRVMQKASTGLVPKPLPGTAWEGTHVSRSPGVYRAGNLAASNERAMRTGAPATPPRAGNWQSQRHANHSQQVIPAPLPRRRPAMLLSTQARPVHLGKAPPLPSAKPSSALKRLTAARIAIEQTRLRASDKRLTKSTPSQRIIVRPPSQTGQASAATAQSGPGFPSDRISEDFIARALADTSVASTPNLRRDGGSRDDRRPASMLAGHGFDAEDIRQRLQDQGNHNGPSQSAPRGMMTLGGR